MGYDGSIKFDTKLDEKGFKKGVKGLEGIAKKSLGGINKIFKATGVAVAGIGAIAVRSGAEFQKSMNRVGALANATDAEMEKLTRTARQLGKDTVFSAQEASEGMQNLAMAGFKVNEITEAMPGLLDLAAAGQTDLATTSDITASMLRGFQLEASESGRVADVMAKGFTNSNTSLETLGESMKYVAPVASSLGFSIEETTAALGKLGDAGIKGSQAGTAVRAMLNRLVDASGPARKELDRLGVSIIENSGEMKDFPTIIKDIEMATKDMTEAEKAATLSKIAGTNASSALMALVNEGGDSLAAFTKELDNAGGTAQEIAERQLKGLIGQFELLKSELSEVGLKIYDGLDMPLGALLGTFREYVGELDRVIAATQSFRDILNSDSGPDARALALDTSDIPDPAQYLAQGIANVVTDMIVALTESLPQVIETGGQFVAYFLQGIQEKVPELSESLSNIITSMLENYITLAPQLLEIGIGLITNIMQGIAEASPQLIDSFSNSMASLIDTIIENIPLFIQAGTDMIVALAEGLSQNLGEIIAIAIEVVVTLADAIISNTPKLVAAGLDIILALVQGVMDNLPTLIEEAPRIINDFTDALMTQFPKLIKTAALIMKEIAVGLVKAIPVLIKNIPAIIRAVINAFMLYNWAQLGGKMVTNIANGFKNLGPKLVTAASNLGRNTVNAIKLFFKSGKQAGAGLVKNLISGMRSLVSNLLGLAGEIALDTLTAIKDGFLKAPDIGRNLVEGIWNGISGATGWLMGKVKGFASDVVSGVKGFFGIHSPSRVFRDEIGTQLVRGIIVGIQDETPALRQVSEEEMMKLVDDYALYGREAAKAYGKLSHQELKDLQKQHKDDGKALAEAIAEGIEENTDRVVSALENLRRQTIRQLDNLGQATTNALKNRYRQEEEIALGRIDKQLALEKEASQDRINIYENEAQRKIELLDKESSDIINMLQAQIDSIYAELDAENEAEEERQYKKKLAAAKEKVRVAKTNKERVAAEEALQELISEKERKEFEKRKKQEIKDLQNSIKNIEKNARNKKQYITSTLDNQKRFEEKKFKEVEEGLENERESIKKHYETLMKEEHLQTEARKLILAENNEELIKLLESYNPYWLDAGQSFGESLLDGLNSMKYEIEDVVNDMLSMVATTDLANAKIIQAKLDYEAARLAGDKKGMADAHKQAEKYRKQGGTIGADIGLNTKNYERELNQRSQDTRAINPYKNGVVQNIKIISPENTPAENARQMKRKGEELILDY